MRTSAVLAVIAVFASCAAACGSSPPKTPDMQSGTLGAPPLPTTADDPKVPDVAPQDLGSLAAGNCDPHQFLTGAIAQCTLLKTKGADATGGAGKSAITASDEDACTTWSSGGMPPAFVMIDLGSDQPVSAILLVPEVTPPDVEMSNVIEASDSKGTLHAIGELKGHMLDEHGILAMLPKPTVARYLRITTLGSPAWVSWREVSAVQCGR